MIGQQLGPYSILEEIGRGGMATVFRAHQPSVHRDVAIKLIKKSIAENPDAIQRFQREARLIARLEHIHILPVYDFDGSHNPPYIVMRYLEGGTLKEIMKQGLLPPPEVAYLMRQVCAAVDYAHRQGIMHRDLKPSNVMIDQEGNAFVTDFGIARLTVDQEGDKQITKTGIIVGTPAYMSPEQLKSSDVIDHRTDVYMLGVMVFEMLTGQLPYESPTPMGVMMKHLSSPIPSAIERNNALPEAIDGVIVRALAKEPDDRYATAADLADALTETIGNMESLRPSRLQEAASASVTLRLSQTYDRETGSSTTPSEQNKMVTVLYASAIEYSLLIEEVAGAEAAVRGLTKLWQACKDLVGAAGGTVLARMDTEFLALWGIDITREHDSEQAINTALTMQMTLRALGATFLDSDDGELLPLNIGVNSGMTLLKPAEDGETYTAMGSTISIANRLMQQAYGTILITQDVFRQVMGIFVINEDVPIRIRGRKQAVETYRVIEAKARSFRIDHRGIEGVETQLIGREAELRHLQKAYLYALEDAETQVVTITAEAGIGKSRLLNEFSKWGDLREEIYRIFRGRATAGMIERPYAFIRDIVSFRFEILNSDEVDVVRQKLEAGVEDLLQKPDVESAHMIGQLCGFDLSDSPHIKGVLSDPQQLVHRAHQLFIRLVIRLARDIQPVVFELDDIHYADEDSLDLLNEMFLADEALPLLVICATRPNLFQRRPEWGSGQTFHTRLDLKPLDKRDSRDLVYEILQKVDSVPKGFRDLLIERAEGNPYFLEELIKMLIDDHVIITESNDRWDIEESRLEALQVPTTLNGLLEARLDTLLAPEKLTLQRAAVVGRIFYDSTLKTIDDADDYHIHDLEDILDKLVENDFIYRRETSAFAGSTEYIFASNLLRDAISKALLERQVKIYNLAAGEWLVASAGERANEYLPLIAQYYERGGQGEQAASYLVRAGKQALQIGAYSAAREAFERAYTYTPDDFTLLTGLGETIYNLAGLDAAQVYLRNALRQAGSEAQRAEALAVTAEVYSQEGRYEEARQLLVEALPLARAGTNHVLLSRVLYGLGDVGWRQGKLEEAENYLQESLKISRYIEDSYRELFALNRLATLRFNNTEYEQAEMIFQEMISLARQVGNQDREMVALNNLAEVSSIHPASPDGVQKSYTLQQQALAKAYELKSVYHIGIFNLNVFGYAVQLGAFTEARKYLFEGLKTALMINSKFILIEGIFKAAYYFGVQGQTQQALAFLGLAKDQPEFSSEHERELSDLIDKLGFTPEEVEIGMVAGKALDFDGVVHEILAVLEAEIAENR